jgi:predicted nuclease of restriction endonuclease-like (RecB) superfamily
MTKKTNTLTTVRKNAATPRQSTRAVTSASLSSTGYDALLKQIFAAYATGQHRAVQAVNTVITATYWRIGRHIVEFEQGGQLRADYGTGLLDRLARDLSARLGKGFSRSNIVYMRRLYLFYPIRQKPSDELSWSHYVELLRIEDPLERGFYEQQAIAEKWSLRELRRQKKSAFFLRLAASKDKAGILQLAQRGQVIETPADILRDPYVFEFLKIPEDAHLTETELETRLCDNIANFLLELGKGFTFVKRQFRVTFTFQKSGRRKYTPRRRSGWRAADICFLHTEVRTAKLRAKCSANRFITPRWIPKRCIPY